MNKEAQKEKLLKQRAYLENLISYNQKFFNPNDITALELINYLQPYQQAFLRLKNEEAKKIDSTIDDGHAHFISHANLFETSRFGNFLYLEVWHHNFFMHFSTNIEWNIDEFKRIYGPKAYSQLMASCEEINKFLIQNRIEFSSRVIGPANLPVAIIPGDDNTLLVESLNDTTFHFENYFKLVSPQREERLLKENLSLANQLLSTISIEDNRLSEKVSSDIKRTRQITLK